MPTSKANRRSPEKKAANGRLSEKSSSFHGRNQLKLASELPRPKAFSEMLSDKQVVVGNPMEEEKPRLTKLLLNVTIQGSVGPVQVVMSPESTVGDLVARAVRQYAKEGRRPILPSTHPAGFDLHYSQFSIESLGREEKLISLGSRNFFVYPKKAAAAAEGGATSSCSKRPAKRGFPWVKIMNCLL